MSLSLPSRPAEAELNLFTFWHPLLLKVIAVFHGAGLALELFKTHAHAWACPEPGWTKIAGVPLYSGFMYASVASYLCQAWRRLDVSLSCLPAGLGACGRDLRELFHGIPAAGCPLAARRADCVRLSADLGVVHGLR